ncbi:outer membrane porin, OprD family [Pseudomonas sp. LTGT-11-2Z]|uniref:OprD family outer membrane porin n=1 Tax=Pseudomonas sp. LTGT-11-2Z TaxID=2479393 RepID=UPI000EFCBDBB|nr:OprD family outer membrane porin [Pseudomonas sp. LTGT-11-2Z]AYO00078.1 outer membrane porin, OprD family [Pseudomonas sp. LTGT-11-2Z]MCT8190363.1 OprD family porin [Pseudomonas monteilii]
MCTGKLLGQLSLPQLPCGGLGLSVNSLLSLGFQLLREQLFSAFRARGGGISDAQVAPQKFDSITMLVCFLGVLAVFGDQAFVVADHSGESAGGGTAGLRLLPIDSEGKPGDQYSRVGAALKLRASKSTLKYGEQMPMTPVLAVNTVRLFPSAATGIQLNVNEFDKVALEAGHFTRQTGVDSSNSDDKFTTDYALKRGGTAITYDSASFLGGRYQEGNLSLALYAGQLEDAWHQYYGNTKYTYAIDEGRRLAFDFNIYRTLDYGKSLAGPINNTSWSFSTAYTTGAHTVTVVHQRINGDEPLDWIGFGTMGGTVNIGNAVQYATFTEANERSWQLRYDFDFAALGIPGLSFMTRYVRGDGMDNSHSHNPYYTARHVYDTDKDNKHWERNFDIKYVIQSGPARDMSFRLRQSTHRGTSGYRYIDIDEVRLITEFPVNIF